MTIHAHIVGWGKYVPERVLTNNDLTHVVDTSEEWIRTRTGIVERHIVADDETTATMAIEAAHQALEMTNLRPIDLDLIIVATATPDYSFPATACLVQDALGVTHAAAFDLEAGCSGFVYGVGIAAGLIESGHYKNALVIGADTLSRVTDWDDRTTCVLFGDGAGAVILHANGAEGGVLSSVLGADGSGSDLLCVPAGGSRQPPSHQTVSEGQHYLKMKGREVFRFAVRAMPAATRQALREAGLTLDDLSLVIPHQANYRITDASAKALKIPPDKVYSNVDRYGNTSAASIPIALCEAVEQDRVHRDDVVVFVGFGAGLTWAAAVVRWSAPLPAAPPTPWKRTWYDLSYRYAAVRSLLRRFVRWLISRLITKD
jgi:3-oxoacyl-[acyl-carrier-protein] synthase-3